MNKSLKIGFLITALCLASVSTWWFLLRDKQLITAHIKDWANDPESVVLRDLRQSKRDKEVWCGEVNARNRLGGMVGFQKFVFTQPGFGEMSADREISKLLAKMTLQEQEGFDSRFRLYCQ